MIRVIYFLFVFIATAGVLQAQSVNVPLDPDYIHKIERLRILNGKTEDFFHSSFKPYTRKKVVEFLDGLDADTNNKTVGYNKSYILLDSWEYGSIDEPSSARPLLKYFYKVPTDLYNVSTEGFDLHVNPILYLAGGSESSGTESNYVNTRGIEIRGMIDDKIGFYSFLGENQMRVPEYVDNYIADNRVVPHEGFWKNFKGSGYDYFTVRGYMSFQATKHVNIQFGYDRHKIGNGMRSLLLSDFSAPNLYLKLQTNLWKFNYTNLYTQLTEDNRILASGRYPEKYMVLHHLSLNLTKRINIGFFESIMYGGKQYGGFQAAYLNPVIFYRAVEQQNGSSDNAMVGMDLEWLLTKGVSLYSQFVLDEFLLSNIKEGNGWWANKSALQLGMNYINVFGTDGLDLKAEFNTVRPYTYSHFTTYGSYTNFQQSLAHPWGANFREINLELRYQPFQRLELHSKFIKGKLGKDGQDENWGGNILKDYKSREMDFGNETAQGVVTDITYASLKGSYMLKHNLFIDGKYIYRVVESEDNTFNSKNNIFSVALRLNIASRNHEF